jgi:hypothetical protein
MKGDRANPKSTDLRMRDRIDLLPILRMLGSTVERSIVDTVRRWANLIFAAGQVLVTYFAFGRGTSFQQATDNGIQDPPIVPADYAFIIWSLIYASSLAYAIYQFRPALATNPLLRRIGFFTAGAFGGCCGWLLAARANQLWMTVGFILWMAFCLFWSFAILWRSEPLAVLPRGLILMPISLYSGWITVAIFANSASVIKAHRWPHFLLSETGWSVAIVLVAGVIVSAIVAWTRGNLCYAITVLWALTGIAVRNFTELANPTVAWSALAVAAFILTFTLFARFTSHTGHGFVERKTEISH